MSIKTPFRRRAAVVAAGLVASVGLSACAAHPHTGASGGNAKDGYTFAGVFCVCFANAYVAWKEGFFEEEGVPVKDFVMTAGGSDTFAALAGGNADFALSGLDAIMRGQESGLDVRSVATISPEFYSLAVSEANAESIQDVGSLEGKKVAISKPGSASYAFLKLLLDEAGMSDKDVTMVPLGGIDTTLTGLQAGRVDAAVVWEPGTAQVEADHSAEVLVSSLDPQDHATIYGSDKSISMTLAVTQKTIDADADAVQGAVAALDRADAWMHQHSAEEIAEVLAPLAQGLDEATLVASIENTLKTFPTDSSISEAAYLDSAERLKAAGIVATVPPVEDVFDCEVGTCSQ